MNRNKLFNDVRRKASKEPSSEDQLLAIAIHLWVGTRPDGPTLSKTDLEEVANDLGVEFSHKVSRIVGNLEDHGFLSGFQRQDQPEWWVIRERDGEFVMGDDFPPAVNDELERAIQHIQLKDPPRHADPSAVADGGYVPVTSEGETLREVLAERFGTPPSALEGYLRSGSDYDRREKLEDVVEVIEESSAFSMPDSFDKIVLRHRATQHHLSKATLRDYNIN